MDLNEQKYFDLLDQIENYDSLVMQLFYMGTPVFTDKIQTACVALDGEKILYKFNQQFFDNNSDLKNTFVIMHESLHIVFGHNLRSVALYEDPTVKFDPKIANISADIIVNNLLYHTYFKKRQAELDDFLKDAVTPERYGLNKGTVDRLTFEDLYYYLIQKQQEAIDNQSQESDTSDTEGEGDTSDTEGENSPDNAENGDKNGDSDSENGQSDKKSDPSFDRLIAEQELIDDITNITKENAQKLKELLEGSISDKSMENFAKKNKQMENEINKSDKSDSGLARIEYEFDNIPVNPVWNGIIEKYLTKEFNNSFEKDCDDWTRRPIRLSAMNQRYRMPAIQQKAPSKTYDILVFLDISASCEALSKDFISVIKSIPKRIGKDKVNLKTVTFTDMIENQIDINARKINLSRRSSCTSFNNFENKIFNMIKTKEIKRYPKQIFVITDGDGTSFSPKKPENYSFFLKSDGYYCYSIVTKYIPKESSIFDLDSLKKMR